MAKQNILLVDDNHQSLRLMEVSLRKAGFVVQTARNGTEALNRMAGSRPAMIIADTDMPGMDGFELCVILKSEPRTADIPFVFLTEEASVDAKVRGLELGADDYLTRPIYTRELLARVRMLLEKHKRRSLTGQHRFFGDLAEMSITDLLQTVEIGKRSGKATVRSGERAGVIWFIDGAVADADAGGLSGDEAVYRLLNWEEGEFEMDFRAQPPSRSINMPISTLLLEGMRRIDAWSRLEAQLPPLSTTFGIDAEELADHQDTVNDQASAVLDRVDGRRDINAVVAATPLPDLKVLQIINRLYFEGVLTEMDGSIAPSAIAPPLEEEPPPIVSVQRSTPRARPAPPPTPSAPRAPVGLVDSLIQSAVDLPRITPEQIAEARQKARSPAAVPPVTAPDPAMTMAVPPRAAKAAAPQLDPVRDRSREMSPELRSLAPPIAAPEPMLRSTSEREPEHRAVSDSQDAPHDAHDDADILAAWTQQRPSVGDALDDDLFGTTPDGPVSRSAVIALGLLLLVIVAVIAFVMRDKVEPFNTPKKALNTGWQATQLQARKAPGSVGAIEGDWTLPARKGGPLDIAPATPSAAIATAAPATAEPANAAPGRPDATTPAATPRTGAPVATQRAIDPLPEPIAADPVPTAGSSAAFANLMKDSQAQAAKGRYALAANVLAKAIKLQPKNADAHLARAEALLEAGKDDGALRDAQTASRLRPSAAKAHLIIGTIYQVKGRKAEAIDAYDKFLTLAPNGRDSTEVRSILQRLR
ncbi:MAG: CheY-like chemotaxis protein [Bradymonadia bacterium]|jgi:CheY-like chemotaxis protein